jgi:anti-sigma regulatory factor (Ser/Thr protein kinase)
MPGSDEVRITARRWALIALFATLVGLLNFGIIATSHWAEHAKVELARELLHELTGAWSLLLLLPALLAFMRRFPIRAGNLWRRLPLHLGATLALGAVHTSMMWGSRSLAYRLLGWGRFDYGDMRYRFPMEYQKQFVIYWMLYGAVAWLASAGAARARELRTAELERRLAEARLSALKMQLNPHFLFNTLNMISSYVREDPERADAMIAHLSDFLRATLRHADVQEVPLATELEFLASYLEIMKARFQDRLGVRLEVAPDAARALVPHLVLQPLVENSLTHCLDDGGGRIRVAAAREADRLRLLVEDDGPGIVDPHEAFGKGVGLTNTRERLRALYGDAQRLELSNRPEGGLRLLLDLPYRAAETA